MSERPDGEPSGQQPDSERIDPWSNRPPGVDPVMALREALARAAIMRTESVHLWAPDARGLLDMLRRQEAAEKSMARGVEDFYGDGPVPLPPGVEPADERTDELREALDAEHRRQDN